MPYTPSQSSWVQARNAVLLWLLLMLLLTGGYGLLYHDARRELVATMQVNQQALLAQARLLLHDRLQRAHNDLQLLASNPLLHRYLDNPSDANRRDTEAFFLDMMRSRSHLYDQVRYLDEQGMEIIRANLMAGAPIAATPGQLQNKSQRYYVTHTLALPHQGDLYLSPFDLNIEYGQIERPIKPTLRFGTRVYNAAGDSAGLIVLNYLGQPLLQQLQQMGKHSGLELWMTNEKGDWLIGPTAEHDWNFMFPERQNLGMARSNPELWQQLEALPDDGEVQLPLQQAWFSLTRFDPVTQITHQHPGSEAPCWYLLAILPASAYQSYQQMILARLARPYAMLSVILALLATGLSSLAHKRRHAVQLVHQREQEMKALLEAAPDVLIVTDANGNILMANPRLQQEFGFHQEQVQGQAIEMLIPMGWHGQHRQYRQQYMQHPTPRAMGQGKDLFARRADGSEFPVSVALSPLHHSDGLRVICSIRNISALYHAKRQQEQTSQRLQIAADAGQLGIWEYDFKADRLLWDEWMHRLYGIPIGEFQGTYQAWADRLVDQDLKAMQQLWNGKAAQDDHFFTQFRIRHTDGSLRWIKVHALALYEAGNPEPIRLIGTNSDVTADIEVQHQLEEALQRANRANNALAVSNRELEAFSYSVSHDLRAPLRAMDGFSAILLRQYQETLSDEGQDLLQRIRAASQKMGQLIDDMLVLSRISRTELSLASVDLSALAHQVIQDLRSSDPERQIEVEITEGIVESCDPRLLGILLTNLLGNAWKFTGQTAQPRITFQRGDYQGRPCLQISDNGAGFDMNYAGKLFSPFQRLHSSNEFPGTGIGLATVTRIVHKHGGWIEAHGEVDHGATFWFALH